VTGWARRQAAPPVRHVHLGLGSFFRAHQAWYTAHSPDAGEWGIAAFAGRHDDLARALAAQQGLYTLVTRGSDEDRFEVVDAVSVVHGARDRPALLRALADPRVGVVSLTVTESAYLLRPGGGLDTDHPLVVADLAALRAGDLAAASSVPGRLLAALAARHLAGGAPIAVVPCDNVADNGAVVGSVLATLAGEVGPGLAAWLADEVAVVSTVVDRITPATTPDDVALVASATGRVDAAPVVTEPFSEWVLSGRFPAGRPRWDLAGARVTDDIAPFENRKLWLLNGGHSLLGYAGSLRGHTTVAQAVDDPVCRGWLQQWWDDAGRLLPQAPAELDAYRSTVLDRFANPRIAYLLSQVSADGSAKLPIRVLPVLAAARAGGALPLGATRVLAAWVCHLRGHGTAVADARAGELIALAAGPGGVAAVLRALSPALAEDAEVVDAVTDQAAQLLATASPPAG